ncbi:MAG: hypothetical protein KDB91_05340, partial [Bacteroidales bacterium]|nr:hypothetical protein [Bacteroidales bacterium]
MNDAMPGKLKDIRIVLIALLAVAALAAGADILYHSGLEWRMRTARVDARLSSLEREAGKLLIRAENEIRETGDPKLLFKNPLGSD